MALFSIGRFFQSLFPIVAFLAFIVFIIFFIKYLVAKPKIKKHLIIALVSIGVSVVTVIITIILTISLFVFGSIARYGLFAEWHNYPSYRYNYYAYDNDVLFNGETIVKEISDVFRIWYGICAFHEREIVDSNGGMFLLRGPPFFFQIHFPEINHNVNYIHFKEITLETDSGQKHDLFTTLYDITGRFARYMNEFTVNEEDNALDMFLQTKTININRYITLGHENAIRNERLRDEDIDAIIAEGDMSVILNFWDIPIDYQNNESVNIRFAFDVVMTNGKIINFVFDDTYGRKYYYSENSSYPISPEKFGQDDWNRRLSDGTYRPH